MVLVQAVRKFAACLGLLVVFLTIGMPCVCGDEIIQNPKTFEAKVIADRGSSDDSPGCEDEDCFCCATVSPSSSFILFYGDHWTVLQNASLHESPVAPGQSYYRPPRA
jgi:hypothetical protein